MAGPGAGPGDVTAAGKAPSIAATQATDPSERSEITARAQDLRGNRIVIARRDGTPELFEANDCQEGRFTERVDVLVRVPERDANGPTGRTLTPATEQVYMQPRVAVAAGAKKGIPSPDTYSLQGFTTTPTNPNNQDLRVVVDVIPLTEFGGGAVPPSPLFFRPEELQHRSSEAQTASRQLNNLTGEVESGPRSIVARK